MSNAYFLDGKAIITDAPNMAAEEGYKKYPRLACLDDSQEDPDFRYGSFGLVQRGEEWLPEWIPLDDIPLPVELCRLDARLKELAALEKDPRYFLREKPFAKKA